jgi:hypothetical protein
VKRPDYTLLGEAAYAQFKMEPLLSHLDLRGCCRPPRPPPQRLLCFGGIGRRFSCTDIPAPPPNSNDTLNDPLLSRLGDNLLHLRSIDIRGCSKVSRNAAQALGARLADRWQTEAKANAVQYDF